MTELQKALFSMQDLKYRGFQSALMPTVDKERVIGVRIPQLRKFAKAYYKNSKKEAEAFLCELPHKYFEEYALHGFLIEQIKDFDKVLFALDEFLPYVDNWAICDCVSPKVLGKRKTELYAKILEWTSSGKCYTVRYGIGMLMRYFLDGDFSPSHLDLVASLECDEYYVNMMIAWYFATALAKQYDLTIPFLEEKRLSEFTHNKTIRKAIESYRITDEQKQYLRTLKA
ncbi:MAG: DNA alkylation repair protein [Ruminococcaceae bacterium]|nr:DNA alkylation repair protein [Oscillospiraceae bacterium]